MSKQITILGYKYGNIPHYEWRSTLLEQTKDYIIVLTKAPRKIKHHTKGQIFDVPGYSIEYYSFVDWYTVSLAVSNGEILDYYCNIACPAILKDHCLSFIDLDLDIIYTKETGWKIIDVDDFWYNSRKYKYSKELRNRTILECRKLYQKAITGKRPFNETLTKYIDICEKKEL